MLAGLSIVEAKAAEYYFIRNKSVPCYFGGYKEVQSGHGAGNCVVFTNTTPGKSHYVKFLNAIGKSDSSETFDLVLLPYGYTGDNASAAVTINSNLKSGSAIKPSLTTGTSFKDGTTMHGNSQGYRLGKYDIYIYQHTDGAELAANSKRLAGDLKLCLQDIDGWSHSDGTPKHKEFYGFPTVYSKLTRPKTQGKTKLSSDITLAADQTYVKTQDVDPTGGSNKYRFIYGTLGTDNMSGDNPRVQWKGHDYKKADITGLEYIAAGETAAVTLAVPTTGYTLVYGEWNEGSGSHTYGRVSKLTTDEEPLTKLTVNCVDKVGNKSGATLTNAPAGAPAAKKINAGASVGGYDWGKSTANDAYHNGYRLTGETRIESLVDDNETVYRFFVADTHNVICEDRVGSTSGILLGSLPAKTYKYNATAKGTDWNTSYPTTRYTGYTFSSATSVSVTKDGLKVYRYFTANKYPVICEDRVGSTSGTLLGSSTTGANYAYGSTVKGSSIRSTAYTGYTYQSDTSCTIGTGTNKVYRIFKANTYTNKLKFEVNGGTAKTESSKNVTYPNTAATHNTGTTSRTGYTFDGWKVTSSPSGVPTVGTVYRASTDITVGKNYVVGNQEATVQAQWKPNITCEDRVSSATGALLGTQAAKSYAVGQTAKGTDWGTPSANGTPYAGYRYVRETSLGVTATSGGAKVYRIFEPYYTVTYKGNGATSGTEKAEAKYYNVDYIIKGNDNWTGFVKTNNKFTGWSGSNNTNYDDPDNVEHHYNGNNNLVLYAQWEPTAYELTVKFETGINKTVVDGEESDNKDRVPIMVQPGTEVSLDAIVRPGYKFDIWKDISDTALPDFKDDTAATMLTMPEHNVTLVATAFCLTPQEDVVKNKYTTVPVSVSDGVVQDIVFHNSMTGSETYKQESVKDGDKLIKNTFTMQPYTEQTDGNITTVDEIAFRGWVLDPATFDKNDPKVDFYDEDAYKLAEGQQDKKTVDLYAVWQLHIVVTKPDGTVISQGWDYK